MMKFRIGKKYSSSILALSLGAAVLSPLPSFALTAGSGACAQTYSIGSNPGVVSVAENGGYCYVAFKNTGLLASSTSFNWTVPQNALNADFLVVAGGGGGGSRHQGGGGAGGVLKPQAVSLRSVSQLTISVGAGGAGGVPQAGSIGSTGSAGVNSQVSKASGTGAFSTILSYGGGGGSTSVPGGSGGGGYESGNFGAALGTSGQGNSGANGGYSNNTWSGGGGGGAGSGGATGSSAGGGAGGNGTTWLSDFNSTIASTLSLTDISGVFGGGGGGGIASASVISGGSGGNGGGGAGGGTSSGIGPSGAEGVDGVAFTGGGGGGSGLQSGQNNVAGGDGGSGVVILRYSLTPISAPQNVTATAGFNSIDVSWTAPAELNGQIISGYKVEYSTTGSGSWSVASNAIGANATSYSITGLTPGTAYYVRVVALTASWQGVYGYPWTKVFETNQLARSGSSTGNFSYSTGYGTAGRDSTLARTDFSRVRYRIQAKYSAGDPLFFADVDFAKNITSPYAGSESYDSLSRLQVPVTGSPFELAGDVSDLTVASNVPGVTQGTGFTGRLEIWPWDYDLPAAAGAAPVNGADNFKYDFADSFTGNAQYGSFQIHNISSNPQTIVGWNAHYYWNSPSEVDLGFGNNTGQHPDWTFAGGLNEYTVARTDFLFQSFANLSVTPLSGKTITFNKNDGGSTTSTQTVETGVATALNHPFSRTGYEFLNWNTAANGTGTKYSKAQAVSIGSDLTLYAIWGVTDPVLYYNSTDSTSFSETALGVSNLGSLTAAGAFNKSISLDSSNWGWVFTGGTNGSGHHIDVGDISTSDFAVKGLTVDFEADFGSANAWERIIDFGLGQQNHNLVITRRDSTNDLQLQLYHGNAFADDCYGSGAQIQSGLHRYTVSLSGFGCKVFIDGSDTPVYQDTSFTALPQSNVSWTQNYVGRANWSGSEFAGTIRSLRVYAGAYLPSQIGAINYKNVSFNPDGGALNGTPASRITSGTLALPASGPTKSGNTFSGWSTSSAGTNLGSTFTPSADDELFALWTTSMQSVTPTLSYGSPTYSVNGTINPTLTTSGHDGTVTYSSTTTSRCTVNGSTGVVTIVEAGSCSIEANFAQSSGYSAATASVTFTIAKANQGALSWDQSKISYSYLGNLDLASALSGGSGTGGISFTATGSCSVTSGVVSGGNAGSGCSITATKGGDVNYNPLSLTQAITINQTSQSALSVVDPGSVVFGQTVQLNSTGGSGTGAVTFNSASSSICVESSIEGEFEFVGVGDCVVTVAKAADTNYTSQSGSRTIAVSKASHTLTFTSVIPANPVVNGNYSLAGASSTANNALAPSFRLTAGSASFCTLSGATVTFVLDGVCEVEAYKDATSTYEAATVVSQRITIGQANQTITFGALTPKTFGDPAFSLTATTTSSNPVTFSSGPGTTNSACSVTSQGLVIIAQVGTCEIVASAASGNGYASASPVTRSFAVSPDTAAAPFITAVSFGDGSLTATYIAPSYLGGGSVSGYRLQAFSGSTLVSTQSSCATSGTLSCTVAGLTNGTSYTLKIAAITQAGLGAESPSSTAVIPAANPAAVSALTAIQGNSKLTITWQTPASLGGGTLDSFRIFHRVAGGSYPQSYINLTASQANAATTNGVTTLEIPGLVNGQAYDVRVVTVTTVNTSQLTSNTAEVTQTPYTVPDAPASVAVLEVGDDIVITWSQPVFDGGSAISGFSVLLDSVAATCATTTASSCTIPKSSLTPGTTLDVGVKAGNDAGYSTPRNTSYQVAGLLVSAPSSLAPSTPAQGPASSLAVVSGKSWAWTKRINKNQIKVFIKYPEMGQNYKISVQKNDGRFVRKMSKTINTTSDLDLLVANGSYYLVRTIELTGEGRYRIQVEEDGGRATLNGQQRPAVYVYR